MHFKPRFSAPKLYASNTSRKLTLLGMMLALSWVGLAPSHAAAVFYTDRNAFLAQLSDGYYLDDLSGLTSGERYQPLVMEQNSARYTMRIYNSSTGDESSLYASWFDGAMSVGSLSGYNYVLTYFDGSEGSGNIYAFGAYVYGKTWNGTLYPETSVTFTLPGSISHTITNINNTTTFLGVISDAPLSWLQVNASFLDYIQFKDPIVNSMAIPEPSSLLLLSGAGVLGLLWKRRKRLHTRA